MEQWVMAQQIILSILMILRLINFKKIFMITKIKSLLIIFLIAGIGFTACKKTEYSLGDLKTPTNLTLTAVVAGVDASNPNGNGSGNVAITTTADKAITYNIDFGDGKTQLVPSGIINYKYT